MDEQQEYRKRDEIRDGMVTVLVLTPDGRHLRVATQVIEELNSLQSRLTAAERELRAIDKRPCPTCGREALYDGMDARWGPCHRCGAAAETRAQEAEAELRKLGAEFSDLHIEANQRSIRIQSLEAALRDVCGILFDGEMKRSLLVLLDTQPSAGEG